MSSRSRVVDYFFHTIVPSLLLVVLWITWRLRVPEIPWQRRVKGMYFFFKFFETFENNYPFYVLLYKNKPNTKTTNLDINATLSHKANAAICEKTGRLFM